MAASRAPRREWISQGAPPRNQPGSLTPRRRVAPYSREHMPAWPKFMALVSMTVHVAAETRAAASLRWPLEHPVGLPGSRVFDVTRFGATPDNRTDSSPAFAAALKAVAAAGGGTLLVPTGGVYLTLPLNLTTSNTRLRVEAGATLKALCDNDRWPRINKLPSYVADWYDEWWFAPFIGASNVQNITLDGGGVIDGSGTCFWGSSHHVAGSSPSKPSMIGTRGNLLLFERVQRAELTGLSFQNSPFWTLHLWDSEDLHVHGISVHNPASSDNDALFFGPNTDGIVRHRRASASWMPIMLSVCNSGFPDQTALRWPVAILARLPRIFTLVLRPGALHDSDRISTHRGVCYWRTQRFMLVCTITAVSGIFEREMSG